MSAHANPDIVDDNLVFIYDTNDGKSYKGEPTENIFLNPTFIGTAGTQTSTVTDNWYFSGYTGDSGFKFYNNSTSPFPLKFSNEGSVITTGANDDSTTQNRRFYCNEVLQAGATYTVSAWIYTTRTSGISIAHFEYGGSSLNSGYFSGTSSHPNHVLGQWYYWEDTYTVGADYTSGLIGPVHTGSSDTIVGIQRFQIEKKSHATPFVDGTRSATQGLLDRTGTAIIDISDASFDSNAQMVFDGTDDYLSLGSNSTLQAIGSIATIECWFKSSSTVGSKFALMVGWGQGTSYYSNFGIGNWFSAWPDESIYVGVNSAAVVYAERDGSAKYHDGNWHHAVGLIGQNNHKIFVDGSEVPVSFSYGSDSVSTSNIFGFSSGTEVYIGLRPYGNGHFQGDLPVVKIYDRLLTAAEVLQNYNATKSRFNL